MKTRLFVAALSLIVPGAARAQPEAVDDRASFDHELTPVTGVLELGIGAGYSQGAGPVGNTMSHLNALTGPGGQLELSLAVRLNAVVALGLYGNFAEWTNSKDDPNDTVYGAGADIILTEHLRPVRSDDPRSSLSAGARSR